MFRRTSNFIQQNLILTKNQLSQFGQYLKKLERFCDYQERCHKEVKTKIRALKIPFSLHQKLLQKLIERGSLNEQRFTESFVRGKFRIQSWGKVRIKNELKARQISDYLIEKTLNQIDEQDYQDTFEKQFLKAESRYQKDPSQKSKQKIFGYLTQKGWEHQRINLRLEQI